jgi:hypothetical protein
VFNRLATLWLVAFSTLLTLLGIGVIMGGYQIPLYQSTATSEAYCVQLWGLRLVLVAWSPIVAHTTSSNVRFVFSVSPIKGCVPIPFGTPIDCG